MGPDETLVFAEETATLLAGRWCSVNGSKAAYRDALEGLLEAMGPLSSTGPVVTSKPVRFPSPTILLGVDYAQHSATLQVHRGALRETAAEDAPERIALVLGALRARQEARGTPPSDLQLTRSWSLGFHAVRRLVGRVDDPDDRLERLKLVASVSARLLFGRSQLVDGLPLPVQMNELFYGDVNGPNRWWDQARDVFTGILNADSRSRRAWVAEQDLRQAMGRATGQESG